MNRTATPGTLAALLTLVTFVALAAPAVAQDGEPAVDFNRQVLPILAKRCFHCHGPDKAEAGLRLNSREAITGVSEYGTTPVVPGQPDESEIIARITETDEYIRMPPEGEPLARTEIDLIRTWIAQGAKWEKHWAFVPPTRPEPPAVQSAAWCRSPIDRFILARLEQAGLTPSQEADRQTWLRRATYDVTGLPPTPRELDAFLADDSPDAYEKVVDRLLASPHYGEKWGRHWLDLVRFAETNSFERDGVKPNAWRYRDYVIRSLNADKPYDQFVREQLAGDEQPDPTTDEIIATGYYRLGVWDDEPADPLLHKFDQFDDIVRTTGEVMLGLTIGCARCHDHKIDPIPQADYYSFLSFFRGLSEYGTRGDQRSFSQWDITPPEVTAKYHELDRQKAELEKQMREIEQRGIVKMPAPDQRATEGRGREAVLREKLQDHLSAEDWTSYQALKEQYAQVEAEYRRLPPRQSALAVVKVDKTPPPTHVLLRGSPHSPGEVVEPEFPAIFGGGLPEITPTERSSGRRTALAEWITTDENMLTARVMANRIWQHHFGRGIVKSPNNFGLLGETPTHPRLLDWLASELVRHEWRLKPLHRMILLSAVYRQSSTSAECGVRSAELPESTPNASDIPHSAFRTPHSVDPGNDLFWRFDMRRLSAEEIRDSVHAVTGQLNPQMYGPGVYPEISKEVLQGQSVPGAGWGKSSPEQQARRSVYVHVKRSLITPLLADFDFADTDNTCPVRFATVQPSQALSLLNGDFLNRQAARFAERLRSEVGSDPEAQVHRALELALCREPAPEEVQRGLKLMARLRESGVPTDETLRLTCLFVLNLNEFVYLD